MRFNTTIARREAIAFDQTELNNDTTTQVRSSSAASATSTRFFLFRNRAAAAAVVCLFVGSQRLNWTWQVIVGSFLFIQ